MDLKHNNGHADEKKKTNDSTERFPLELLNGFVSFNCLLVFDFFSGLFSVKRLNSQ